MSVEEADSCADFELPLIYRIILRFPKISLEGLSDRVQGLVWVLFLPVGLASNVFVILALLTCLFFPYNYIAVLAWVSIISLFILRVLLERALNTRNAMLRQSSFRWDVDKTFEEYALLLSDKERKRKAMEQRGSR